LLTASADCIECPPGYYCPGGSENSPMTDPTPCPIGTYNPLVNASDIQNCRQCELGYACPHVGMDNTTFVPCKEGKCMKRHMFYMQLPKKVTIHAIKMGKTVLFLRND